MCGATEAKLWQMFVAWRLGSSGVVRVCENICGCHCTAQVLDRGDRIELLVDKTEELRFQVFEYVLDDATGML